MPTDALLRDAAGWSVMRVVDGVARRAHIEIGEGSGTHRPVIAGIEAGDTVIRFPPARLVDGQRVRARR